MQLSSLLHAIYTFVFVCVYTVQIDYPEIAEGIRPRHRFMSAYEQHIEPPDRQWQYLLFAAEPYETIAFKVRGCMHSCPSVWP